MGRPADELVCMQTNIRKDGTLFNNMFFDLGEDLGMRFIRADTSKISALAEYKDSPKPIFLFYHAGAEIAKIEGPDLPKIDSTIKTKAPRLREVAQWS